VLDAGCGHGDPVIARLLEKGFHVTGADFSPEMLARARQQFPLVTFVQQATTQIMDEARYDGACTFSSRLYQDPIDFYHSIYRLHHAIKPGGLLFLFAYDAGPDWRGEPYLFVVGQWMWSWHYGMDESAKRLE
jgi:SAM-dependent methyltransferase